MSIVRWLASTAKEVFTKLTVALLGSVITIGLVVNWWSKLWNLVLTSWTWLVSSTDVPRWLVGLFGLCTTLLAYMLVRNTLAALSEETWWAYRMDRFYGMQWHWTYAEDGEICHLRAECDKCSGDCRGKSVSLYGEEPATVLLCNHCPFTSSKIPRDGSDIDRWIKSKILRAIKSGDWREAHSNAQKKTRDE